MTEKINLCIICWEKPATIPDREQMGRPIKWICKECHGARLRGDMDYILRMHHKRNKIREERNK